MTKGSLYFTFLLYYHPHYDSGFISALKFVVPLKAIPDFRP